MKIGPELGLLSFFVT